ncbi:unnamed protein product [Malus baccata var. baccata]
MERYYKKQCLNPSPNIPDSPPLPSNNPGSPPSPSSITADPGLRRRMLDYPLNCREAIHRYYLQKEPCQPKSHIMPRKASDNRCFITAGGSGSDVFTTKGFTNWRKGPENFRVHEGGVGSLHNKAMQQAKDLMTQKQHIETFVIKQTDEARVNYHTLLSGALDCTRCSLEEAIERLFATTNLSMSKLREQGYDGASNMRALVFVAKENEDVANFFINANRLVNLIGSSCKRRDALKEKQQEQIQKALHLAVMEVVEWIKSDRNQDNLSEATGLFKDIQTFDFVFHLFLMRLILGITNELSQALQKKDQDIVNAMALFCEEHDIVIPNMEDLHFVPGKSRRKAPKITNFHYYLVDLYFQVLDMQLKELNDRFNEVNTELLLCMACLSRVNNFASFDKEKIVRLAQLYPQDFDCMDLMNLPIQLDNYIQDMKMHSEFSSLRGISDLAKELVKTGRDVFAFIDNEPIIRRFHDMKPCRQQL